MKIRYFLVYSFSRLELISFMLGYLLYLIVCGALVVSGINPVDRFTWYLEIPWVFVALVIIPILNYRNIKLSTILCFALFFHALVLIYGAAYTYELVPLGEWAKEVFNFKRNHYDRLGHFAQGFFPAILFREFYYNNKIVGKENWLEFFVFVSCMAFTAIFELIEFASALFFGASSDAYLGSQGDIWDAQWDMFFCGVGAIVSILLFRKLHKSALNNF